MDNSIILEIMKHIIQRPKAQGNWLYQDQDNGGRYFTTIVYLADGEPEWPECTDAEKEQWEKEHKPQSEPEPSSEE